MPGHRQCTGGSTGYLDSNTPGRLRSPAGKVLAILSLFLFVAGLAGSPRDALAAAVHIDTSTLAGTDGTLEFLLLDGDGVANNTVTISGITTNGTLQGTDCTIGCTGGPPYIIDDGFGLGEFLQSLNLGTFVSFDLAFTTNFASDGTNAPDRFSLSLLDSSGSFTLVNTDLDFLNDPIPAQDALLIIDLQGEGQLRLPTVTDPAITVSVPEPGTLALFALGSVMLLRRRNRERNVRIRVAI